MKQWLVGYPVGRAAKRLRSRIELATANIEEAGCVANDYLAEYILIRLAKRHFVDVGAHIGGIVSGVRAHCPEVRITAIEPIPEKARRLKGATVHNCALADYEGSSSFFVSDDSAYSSLNKTKGSREIAVAVKRLDSLVSEPDVVKIDVEGAELGVLRGCERLRSRPIYMFESGPGEVLGYTKADLWDWFQSFDYGVFLPNRLAHTAPAMGLEVFLDAHNFPRRTTNYYAVPNEAVEETRSRVRRLIKANRS